MSIGIYVDISFIEVEGHFLECFSPIRIHIGQSTALKYVLISHVATILS